MKELFSRRDAVLEAEDLKRYAWVLKNDLREALDCDDVQINPAAGSAGGVGRDKAGMVSSPVTVEGVTMDPSSGRISVPLLYEGQPLAMLSAAIPASTEFTPDFSRVLSAVITSALEKILLYKLCSTDQETGLYNEDSLLAYLRGELQSLDPRSRTSGLTRPRSYSESEVYPGLSLILIEIVDFHTLTSAHGRAEARRCMAAAARLLLDAAPPDSLAARLADGRLALALPHKDTKSALAIVDTVVSQGIPTEQNLPEFKFGFGLACFPADFLDEAGMVETMETGDLLEHLLAKSELALRQSLASEKHPVFTFQDILRKGGRVVQVLPFNRVVVNLGRAEGARSGQVFSLSGPGVEDSVDFKGEVVLFDVSDDFSVGEVINLRNPLSRVKAGDGLVFSQASGEGRIPGLQSSEDRRDLLLDIPDHHGFIRQLSARVDPEDRFAILLVRVDGYDQYREIRGRLSSDRKLKDLLNILREDLPEAAMVGRFSADCLAVLCPEMDQSGAMSLAETWRDKVNDRHPQTISIGLAVYPLGQFKKADILANAQKALEHAAFFSPSARVAFDSISLNISGDNYYDAGDLEGAIGEYNKALELDPHNLNVLNSLGICHGDRRELDQALNCFDQVIALDPDNLMAHFNRGFTLSMAERPEEALVYLRRAAEIDGANFDVLFQLGKLALELDKVDEALENLEKAAKLNDHRGIVHRYLGQALVRAGREDEAIEVFRAAVRIDPEDALSLSQLAVLYLNKGTDREVALALARQSVEIDQSNSLFRERLARALVSIGDLASAETEYRQVLSMGAQTREVYFSLGQVIKDQGRPEEAEEWFRLSLDLDPEYRPALNAVTRESPKPEA